MLATCGDTYLGGDDFDDRVIDLLADEFVAKHGVNVRKDPYALREAEVRRREREARALGGRRGRDPHPRDRALGRGRDAHARAQAHLEGVRRAGRRPGAAHLQGVRRGAAAGRPGAARPRGRDPGRRSHAAAADPRGGDPLLRSDAEDRRRSGPGRRDGRRHPRLDAGGGDRAGRLPARRHAALAAHRRGRRPGRAGDRAQHARADRADAHLHHVPGLPGVGEDPRLPGRVAQGRARTSCSGSSSSAASRSCRAARSRSTSPSRSTATAS